jgi:microcystin-dependent protein
LSFLSSIDPFPPQEQFVKQLIQRSTSVALLFGLAALPGTGFACSSEPYLASMCIMAWSKTGSFGNGSYLPANGATLPVNAYAALFALLGITYGGDGRTNFQLPDLRGRMVLGAGQNQATGQTYVTGQSGGTATTVLTAAQLPAHNHALIPSTPSAPGVTTTTGLGSLTAGTTLSGLSANTTLGNMTGSVSGANLTLNGSSGGNLGTSPAGASLGSYSGAIKVYSDAAPGVAMKAGSIGGTAAVVFTGNPTTTVTGSPTTTLNGAPSVAVGGVTAPAGGNAAFNNLPPYLVLGYYIAAIGIFPVSD